MTKTFFEKYNEINDIYDLYLHLGGTPTKTPNKNTFKVFRFWKGESNPSLTIRLDQNTAYDEVDSIHYTSYKLALEITGNHEMAIEAHEKVSGLKNSDFRNYNVQDLAPLKKENPVLKEIESNLKPLNNKSIELLKELRGFDFNSFPIELKSCFVLNTKFNNICILYKDLDGKSLFAQDYNPSGKDKGMKYIAHGSPSLIDCIGGQNMVEFGKDLFLVEGFFNMVAMHLSGLNAVSIFNSKANPDLIANWINKHGKRFKYIYLCLDSDKVGREGAEAIIKKIDNQILKKGFYNCYLVNSSENKKTDANDLFKRCKIKTTHFVKEKVEERITEFTPEQKNIKFYSYVGEKNEIKIHQRALSEFLEFIGFRNVQISSDSYKVVRLINNRFRDVNENEVMAILKEKVLCLENGQDIFDKLFAGSNQYLRLGSPALKYLEVVKANNDKDSNYCSKIYYLNGFQQIEKDEIKFLDYSELKNPIHVDDVVPFEYDESLLDSRIKGEFERFVEMTQKGSEERILKVRSTLGFLLHRFDNPSQKKAVVLTDGHGEINSNSGGSGKSLLAKSLKYMRHHITIDGKKYDPNDKFCYQTLEENTEVVYLDDVQKNFSMEKIFSDITEGVTVEQKGKTSYKINAKMIITSNSAIKFDMNDGSTIRRLIEIEFSNYFRSELVIDGEIQPAITPFTEFGHHLFDDWNNQEWQLFRSYMAKNLQIYFNHGLITVQNEGIKKKRLKGVINGEKNERPLLYEFFEDNLFLNSKPIQGKVPHRELNEKYFETLKQEQEHSEGIITKKMFFDKMKEYLNGCNAPFELGKDMFGSFIIIK
jgi:Toprim-like